MGWYLKKGSGCKCRHDVPEENGEPALEPKTTGKAKARGKVKGHGETEETPCKDFNNTGPQAW